MLRRGGGGRNAGSYYPSSSSRMLINTTRSLPLHLLPPATLTSHNVMKPMVTCFSYASFRVSGSSCRGMSRLARTYSSSSWRWWCKSITRCSTTTTTTTTTTITQPRLLWVSAKRSIGGVADDGGGGTLITGVVPRPRLAFFFRLLGASAFVFVFGKNPPPPPKIFCSFVHKCRLFFFF